MGWFRQIWNEFSIVSSANSSRNYATPNFLLLTFLKSALTMIQCNENLFLIGQVKNISGISIRTIRYYESLGLIESSQRTQGGFRQFSAEVFARLSFIKRAQALGLSLQEIGEILQVYDGGKLPCDDIQRKLKQKIEYINKQIDDLVELRGELRGLISDWHSVTTKPKEIICPNIQK